MPELSGITNLTRYTDSEQVRSGRNVAKLLPLLLLCLACNAPWWIG